MRELYSLRIEHSDDEMQLFLEGSDFLPFMPATLMQLLLDIGTGTLDACCIPSIFAGEHSYSGMLLPMHCIFMILFIFQIERMIF